MTSYGGRRVEPRFHRQHQRLGRGHIVNRDEQVRDELHLRPGAEVPDVKPRAGERVQDRRDPAIRPAVAAREDDQVFHPRLRSGSAQRAIEQRRAAGGQRLPRRFLDGDRQRAGFDHDELRPPGRGELARDLPQRLGRRQRANHHAGLTRDVAAVIRRLPAGAAERPAARLEHVVPDHPVLRTPEVRRHRGPHDAETDHADGTGGPGQRLKCKGERAGRISPAPRRLHAESPCSPPAARDAMRRRSRTAGWG